MKIYLAHPFLEKGFGNLYTAFLESRGYTVCNPFRDVEQGKKIYDIMLTEMAIICETDAVVVLLTDAVTRAVHMEAFYAWTIGKPVIVVWKATDSNKSWYPAFAKEIVSDSNELLLALERLQ